MSKLAQNDEKIKTLTQLLTKDNASKLALAKHLLELNLLLINELLEDEVCSLAGQRYSRDKPHNGKFSRWGSNPGSVRIGEERVPVSVPRVYDQENKENISLGNYKSLREAEPDELRLMNGLLHGLSTKDYGKVIRNFSDSFGLSKSSVSNRFIKQSTEAAREFNERDLSEHTFVALYIDGKYLAKQQMVIALGVTDQGDKLPLGFIQTSTENSRSIKELLSDLLSRGFSYDVGFLCLIDGAKGLRKAVDEVFGHEAIVQRCQWHKRENVLSYLSEKDKKHFKRKLNAAYLTEDYKEAKLRLEDISDELSRININACNSLKEGLEETLTIHRLELKSDFGKSFSTTNIIENLNSQLGKYLGRVKYWKTSDQRQRWLASALLEIENKMRKVDNYKILHLLVDAIKIEIKKRSQ